MTKKWIAFDLVLLAFAAWLGWELRVSILQFNAENDIAKIQPVRDAKPKVVQDKPAAKVVPVKNYNPAEFAVIPEKNIFSDTRSKEDRVAETLAPPEPPPLAQKPILVGVTIDPQPRASIIDPTVPQGRDRRAQIKRIGDVYQGYTITEISPERMVLESGTRKEVIPLREGSKRGPQVKTPILSTRIVPFGGGITGGTPISISGGPAAAAPPRTTLTPIGTPAGAAAGQTVTPARTNTVAQPSTQPAQPAQAPSTPGGVRIIHTPFGDIREPAP